MTNRDSIAAAILTTYTHGTRPTGDDLAAAYNAADAVLALIAPTAGAHTLTDEQLLPTVRAMVAAGEPVSRTMVSKATGVGSGRASRLLTVARATVTASGRS